jgi:hypothetical protein
VWDTGEVHTGLWSGDLRERYHLEDLSVDGEGNIKTDLLEGRYRGMDWMDMAGDRDNWRTVVNAVMNLRFP